MMPPSAIGHAAQPGQIDTANRGRHDLGQDDNDETRNHLMIGVVMVVDTVVCTRTGPSAYLSGRLWSTPRHSVRIWLRLVRPGPAPLHRTLMIAVGVAVVECAVVSLTHHPPARRRQEARMNQLNPALRLTIFIGDCDKWHHKPLSAEIVHRAHQ